MGIDTTRERAGRAARRAPGRGAQHSLASSWLPPLALAVTLALATWWAGWVGADAPAHVFRVALFRDHGFTPFEYQWYAGHHTVMYSVLFPALGALIGAFGLALTSLAVSVVCFHQIVRRLAPGTPARVASLLFALGMTSNVVEGRYTFQLGLAVALTATLAALRRRWALALVLGAASGLASPVAGTFLALGAAAAAGAAWLERPRPRSWRHLDRPLVGLVAATTVPMAVTSMAFPEGGWFPFGVTSFLPALVATAAVAVLSPWLPVRLGAVLYTAVLVAAFVVPSPVGANASRLAMYLALPVVVLASWTRPALRRALVLAVPALLAWQWLPAVDAVAAPSDPSTDEAFYTPLRDYLAWRAPEGTRVEIPPTQRHWEAAYLADDVALARGWNRQLDLRWNDLFYEETPLDAGAYLRWLQDTGVRFVALPDAPLDVAALDEAELLRRGVPGLVVVWSNPDWVVWEVLGAHPLVEGSARLVDLDADAVVLHATGAGPALVRVRYSRYLEAEGDACVSEGPDGWTVVHTTGTGQLRLTPSLAAIATLGVVAADGCPSGPG